MLSFLANKSTDTTKTIEKLKINGNLLKGNFMDGGCQTKPSHTHSANSFEVLAL